MQHQQRATAKAILCMMGLATLITIWGCVSEPKAARPLDGGTAAPSIEVNMPPKKALAEIRQIVTSAPISLPIQEEKDGVLVTGWESHQGTFRIARHWQERTSYRIQVIPDWNEPTGRAKVQVSETTQERASDKEGWAGAPNIQRPQRAKELLERIRSALPATR